MFRRTQQGTARCSSPPCPPFCCISIDTEGRAYLHYSMVSPCSAVLDEMAKLPLKIAGIYRCLTIQAAGDSAVGSRLLE